MVAKSLKFLCGLVVCGVLAFPLVSSAGTRPAAWKFAESTPEAFEAQAAEVRKEMGTDGKYSAISVDDRTAVDTDLARIDALLKSKGSATKLNDAEQVDLMNAQERINAILTKNDGNRLICTLEPRTGSNFKQKICRTEAERAAIRRSSQKAFQDDLMRGSASQAPGN